MSEKTIAELWMEKAIKIIWWTFYVAAILTMGASIAFWSTCNRRSPLPQHPDKGSANTGQIPALIDVIKIDSLYRGLPERKRRFRERRQREADSLKMFWDGE